MTNLNYLQNNGDRYYGNVKLRLSLVQLLKKMNSVYPKTSSDFDLEFLRYVLREIFTKVELRNCASSSSLRALNPSKLQVAKGDNNYFNMSYFKR